MAEETNELEELRQQFEEAHAAETAPAPVERTLGDGTKIVAADQDELFQKVEAHYAEARGNEPVAATPPPVPMPQKGSAPNADTPAPKTFNALEWAETIQKDPIAAQAMLDEARYGADPVKIIKELREQNQAITSALTEQTVRAWYADNPDLEMNPQTNHILSTVLQSQGLGVSRESLDYAKQAALANKWILAKEKEESRAATPPPPAPPVPPAGPAPALTTGAGADLTSKMLATIENEDIPIEKITDTLMEMGAFHPGSADRFNG